MILKKKKSATVQVGDRVVLKFMAITRNLGVGFRRGMKGTVKKITKTTYGLLGKYKPHITIPQKRYWVELDTPTKAMRKGGIKIWGFFGDEIKKTR